MSVQTLLSDLKDNKLSTDDLVRTLELDLADAWDRLPVTDSALNDELNQESTVGPGLPAGLNHEGKVHLDKHVDTMIGSKYLMLAMEEKAKRQMVEQRCKKAEETVRKYTNAEVESRVSAEECKSMTKRYERLVMCVLQVFLELQDVLSDSDRHIVCSYLGPCHGDDERIARLIDEYMKIQKHIGKRPEDYVEDKRGATSSIPSPVVLSPERQRAPLRRQSIGEMNIKSNPSEYEKEVEVLKANAEKNLTSPKAASKKRLSRTGSIDGSQFDIAPDLRNNHNAEHTNQYVKADLEKQRASIELADGTDISPIEDNQSNVRSKSGLKKVMRSSVKDGDAATNQVQKRFSLREFNGMTEHHQNTIKNQCTISLEGAHWEDETTPIDVEESNIIVTGDADLLEGIVMAEGMHEHANNRMISEGVHNNAPNSSKGSTISNIMNISNFSEMNKHISPVEAISGISTARPEHFDISTGKDETPVDASILEMHNALSIGNSKNSGDFETSQNVSTTHENSTNLNSSSKTELLTKLIRSANKEELLNCLIEIKSQSKSSSKSSVGEVKYKYENETRLLEKDDKVLVKIQNIVKKENAIDEKELERPKHSSLSSLSKLCDNNENSALNTISVAEKSNYAKRLNTEDKNMAHMTSRKTKNIADIMNRVSSHFSTATSENQDASKRDDDTEGLSPGLERDFQAAIYSKNKTQNLLSNNTDADFSPDKTQRPKMKNLPKISNSGNTNFLSYLISEADTMKREAGLFTMTPKLQDFLNNNFNNVGEIADNKSNVKRKTRSVHDRIAEFDEIIGSLNKGDEDIRRILSEKASPITNANTSNNTTINNSNNFIPPPPDDFESMTPQADSSIKGSNAKTFDDYEIMSPPDTISPSVDSNDNNIGLDISPSEELAAERTKTRDALQRLKMKRKKRKEAAGTKKNIFPSTPENNESFASTNGSRRSGVSPFDQMKFSLN